MHLLGRRSKRDAEACGELVVLGHGVVHQLVPSERKLQSHEQSGTFSLLLRSRTESTAMCLASRRSSVAPSVTTSAVTSTWPCRILLRSVSKGGVKHERFATRADRVTLTASSSYLSATTRA